MQTGGPVVEGVALLGPGALLLDSEAIELWCEVLLEREIETPGEIGELADEVTPLTHLGIGEVGLLREGAGLGLREFGGCVVPPGPELQGAEEVRTGDAEGRVGLSRLLALVDGTAPGVVAGHGGDDWNRGGEDGVVRGGEQHAREAGLDGDLRQFASDVGEADARLRILLPGSGTLNLEL